MRDTWVLGPQSPAMDNAEAFLREKKEKIAYTFKDGRRAVKGDYGCTIEGWDHKGDLFLVGAVTTEAGLIVKAENVPETWEREVAKRNEAK